MELLSKIIRGEFDISYQTFKVRKESGKLREINTPNSELKEIQKYLLEITNEVYQPHKAAHAFVKGHSLKTCLQPHIGKDFIISLDIQDFFPSIPIPVVYDFAFQYLTPTLLKRAGIELNKTNLHNISMILLKALMYKDRVPQGACTSPAISNFAMQEYDRAFSSIGAAEYLHILAYTRYADDLIFSIDPTSSIPLFIESIIERIKPYKINKKKIRISKEGKRTEILGIKITKSKLTLGQDFRNGLRGYLHSLGLMGLDIDEKTKGMLSFLGSIDILSKEKLMGIYNKALARGRNGGINGRRVEEDVRGTEENNLEDCNLSGI